MASGSPEQRFWMKVVKLPGPDACWLWTAGRNPSGYGHFKIKGKMVLAHRFAWFIATGKWPDPCALHSCDNPLCVRGPFPGVRSHLFEGTQVDNITDMMAKGRARIRGEESGATKLTDDQVQEIRRLYYGLGFLQKDIAAHFKVSTTSVRSIVRRVSWTHLPIQDCEPDNLRERECQSRL